MGLKPLNSFPAMERMIASAEESAHLQGMSVWEMLVAANAMTAAALRQIMVCQDPEVLVALCSTPLKQAANGHQSVPHWSEP